MAARIIYTAIARNDLKEIYAYICKNSLRFAQKEVHDIREKIKGLKLNLYLGHPFNETNDEQIREFVYKNYRIIYFVSPDLTQIQILTIHHHARSLINNPAFDTED